MKQTTIAAFHRTDFGDEGLIEIKCKQDKAHLFTILSGKIDPKHVAQMQYQMLLSGRKWCDYVCFNPMFKNPLYVQRVLPDGSFQSRLTEGINKGKILVQQYIRKYKEKYL